MSKSRRQAVPTPPSLLILPSPVVSGMRPRLHGEVCARCGSGHSLIPAGVAHTITPTGRVLTWPVKACPRHLPHAMPDPMPEPAP